MSTKKSLVSVIMPVYNGSLFVAEAIESILQQTYKPLELIIVNDASTDSTADILRAYKNKFSRLIRVINSGQNHGDCASANIAFKKSRGEFITRMDADDIAHPQKVELQVKFMKTHPNVIVLGTQADVINAENEIVGQKSFPQTHKEIYKNFAVLNPMLHPSCMFRRSLLPVQGYLYESGYKPNDDYITFFKLLNYGKFANLPQKLLYYRVHGNNISLQHPKANFKNSLRIRKNAIATLSYKQSLKGKFLMLSQLVLISLMPEKIIVPLYMLLRGMLNPVNLLPRTKITIPTFTSEKALVYEA